MLLLFATLQPILNVSLGEFACRKDVTFKMIANMEISKVVGFISYFYEY